ncbi:hypothetical protein ILUMI_12678 [Ignelater luminosus]|uniref:Transposase n=1 Tax=Ignelater luminosus TaxID=2038154 RepID=A0A8K0CXP4_IGNLU|nr:hypothetical protein ILUMI_12678 [Ignelater luminosus]
MHPHYTIIQRTNHRLRDTGNILPVPNISRGRPRAARNQNAEAVLNTITEDPSTSIRAATRTVNASKSTVHGIIKDNGPYPYHKIRLQNLMEEVYEK